LELHKIQLAYPFFWDQSQWPVTCGHCFTDAWLLTQQVAVDSSGQAAEMARRLNPFQKGAPTVATCSHLCLENWMGFDDAKSRDTNGIFD
jgi:hypothetical protein